MSEEIIYTSAPRGLKPGSRGFCTVASTPGMASTLAALLESLSGYRHLASPGAGQAANPTAYCHLRARVGGSQLQILSRIADAGLDYSGRSNKLAHHVVLNPREAAPAGPAWAQQHVEFHEQRWSGEPRIVPAGRRPPQGDNPPNTCRAWQALAGDAGWAGVLAQSAAAPQPRDVWLLYPPGADVLALVAEAIALLPPPLRWQATYSTFYTKLPPGVECRWRFVPDGTPEAANLRKRYELKALDLCGPLGPPPESEWTRAAREGRHPATPQKVATKPTVAAAQPTAGPVADESNIDVDLELLAPEVPPTLPAIHISTNVRLPRRSRAAYGADKRGAWKLAAALFALLFISLLGFGAYVYSDYLAVLVAWRAESGSHHNAEKPEKATLDPEQSDYVESNQTQETEERTSTDEPPTHTAEGELDDSVKDGSAVELNEPADKVIQVGDKPEDPSPFRHRRVLALIDQPTNVPLLADGAQPKSPKLSALLYPEAESQTTTLRIERGEKSNQYIVVMDYGRGAGRGTQSLLEVTTSPSMVKLEPRPLLVKSPERQKDIEYSALRFMINDMQHESAEYCDIVFWETLLMSVDRIDLAAGQSSMKALAEHILAPVTDVPLPQELVDLAGPGMLRLCILDANSTSILFQFELSEERKMRSLWGDANDNVRVLLEFALEDSTVKMSYRLEFRKHSDLVPITVDEVAKLADRFAELEELTVKHDLPNDVATLNTKLNDQNDQMINSLQPDVRNRLAELVTKLEPFPPPHELQRLLEVAAKKSHVDFRVSYPVSCADGIRDAIVVATTRSDDIPPIVRDLESQGP